jgi:citrate synthase
VGTKYFIEKYRYSSIDFYPGITLKAMCFPTDMFTVLFAVARTVGGSPSLDSGAKRNALKRSGFERPFQARQSRLGMAS